MTTWTFTVPLPASLPSPNSRLHWAERARRVKEARQLVALAARSERNRLDLPSAKEPRTLRLTRIYSARHRVQDADNLTASLKPAIDGLRDAGWLVDDTPEWLTLLPPEQERGRLPGLRVEVADGHAQGSGEALEVPAGGVRLAGLPAVHCSPVHPAEGREIGLGEATGQSCISY